VQALPRLPPWGWPRSHWCCCAWHAPLCTPNLVTRARQRMPAHARVRACASACFWCVVHQSLRAATLPLLAHPPAPLPFLCAGFPSLSLSDPKPARMRDRMDSQGKLVLQAKRENVPVAGPLLSLLCPASVPRCVCVCERVRARMRIVQDASVPPSCVRSPFPVSLSCAAPHTPPLLSSTHT